MINNIGTANCKFDILQLANLEAIRESNRNYGELNGDKKGISKEIFTPDGIYFGYHNVISTKDEEINLYNESPYIQLSFNILGSKKYVVPASQKSALDLKSLQYNYLHLPAGPMKIGWIGNQKLESFELGITENFFNHILPQDHPMYQRMAIENDRMTNFALGENNLPLQSECTTILFQMLNCPMEGHLRRLYIQAKTVELISLQLKQFEEVFSYEQKNTRKGLSKEEVERMYLVKEIIEKNHNHPCRLIDLAHSVGTNDTYLKKHFKMVFGTTVFSYLLNFKMERAMEMLKQDYSITDVAYATGYNQISHFSRAFKRQFGFPPNKVR